MFADLKGRVALITGAGSGIGRATAERLADAGAAVCVLDANPELGAETVKLITDAGGRAVAYTCDVGDIEALRVCVIQCSKALGPVDILVNNAGVGENATLEQVTPESFDRVFRINVRGAFFAAQAVVPEMKRRRYGRIVNVSSLIAARGFNGNPHYAGAKAALIGFTRSWAIELAPYNICVNTVLPALTVTPMVTRVMDEQMLHQRSREVPMGRLATPDDVARLVRFLVSREADFLSGQAISPNGAEFVGAI